jgi:hypothetical protein
VFPTRRKIRRTVTFTRFRTVRLIFRRTAPQRVQQQRLADNAAPFRLDLPFYQASRFQRRKRFAARVSTDTKSGFYFRDVRDSPVTQTEQIGREALCLKWQFHFPKRARHHAKIAIDRICYLESHFLSLFRGRRCETAR